MENASIYRESWCSIEVVHLDARTEAKLTQAEIATLKAFIDVEHDRPNSLASNLLCYNYGICRSPYTGDAGAEPKALVRRPAKEQVKSVPSLMLKPNPANAWVAVTYDLPDYQGPHQLVGRDALGRLVHQEPIVQAAGQALIDTRALPAGAYTVDLRRGAVPVATERLIIQP